MTLRWFLSKTVRDATAMRKHVEKLLNHQRDILQPAAVEAVRAGIEDLRKTVDQNADKETVEKQMSKLETTANKWIKPYENAGWRENVEVLLVALSVAMAIRTFFLQPFKIPTGSMQPTLYGVTSENLIDNPGFKFPTGWEKVRQWFEGISYVHIVAENDGVLGPIDPPLRLLIFDIKQSFTIGDKTYTISLPPDFGAPPEGLRSRAELHPGQHYQKGEDVVKLKTIAGDHLFVDRLTYNFRPPERGEIVVFETKGIPEANRNAWNIPGDQFYIKRLVGLGGETLQIAKDRHLVVNGKRLDASVPHFEKIYSFDPKTPPQKDHYSGHVDGGTPYFQGHPEGIQIPPGNFMVMGDNTMNSLDSRYWGSFPADAVIGKSFFVYWPLSERFGLGYHR